VIYMFTYIQIIGRDSSTFKGYVDYEISKDNLSMTLVRGMRTLHRIVIPLKEVTDFTIDKFYGEERLNFVYDEKKYSFINTGYGESEYLKHRMLKVINA